MKYMKTYGYTGPATETVVTETADETRFTALQDREDAGYWVEYTLDAPIADSYIMLPACAYNGNRFESVERKYPPMYTEDELGVDVPVRITNVPRLAQTGDSFMDVTSGDLAVPCVCVLNKANKEGFILYFAQGAHGLNFGVTLEQQDDRLTVRLRAPAKRRLVYRWRKMVPGLWELPAADETLDVAAGTETVIPHRVHTFPCADIPALYRAFFELRDKYSDTEIPAMLPFSKCWKHMEDEHNRTHYDSAQKYYTLSAMDGRKRSCFDDWQVGWVGSGINTLPMLTDGAPETQARAVETLEFMARNQSAAGWYYGIVQHGKPVGDCFGHYNEKYNMVMVRKHGDGVYFMSRQILAMERQAMAVPDSLYRSVRQGADALVKLWRTYGQTGQFVNFETGELIVGGSTAGAIVPAALCAAAEICDMAEYVQAAAEIGEYLYRTATAVGVTTGGPGEILQCPDSESAAALLESFTVLHDALGDEKWLDYAQQAAHQAASWVVNYDYEFPADSRFDRMDIHSGGSVWANVQNKHSAPGICTHSPASLLKLYRATGDEKYLRLMGQIARFIPQVTSYPERPMYSTSGRALSPGESCERVNLSDWEGLKGVGDSIYSDSAWPEVALMLTCGEVPGVYVRPACGAVCAADHVDARLENGVLSITNPTAFDAVVKVMIEDEDAAAKPLGLYWQEKMTKIAVDAGKTVELPV
ncbi:MAG: hypothetical protein IJY28_02385 [Clostridia bacterium]|nr:hypothetical protein [Clostridia bacterium]